MRKREAPSIRVQRACSYLKAGGKSVSVFSVCRTAENLDGLPLAATTILRDPLAAEIYRTNRTWRHPPKRKRCALFADLPGDLQQHALNLLKRKKEALVRLLITLEAESAHDKAELRYLRSLELAQRELPALPVDAHAQLGYIHALLTAGRTFEACYRPGMSKPSGCRVGPDAP